MQCRMSRPGDSPPKKKYRQSTIDDCFRMATHYSCTKGLFSTTKSDNMDKPKLNVESGGSWKPFKPKSSNVKVSNEIEDNQCGSNNEASLNSIAGAASSKHEFGDSPENRKIEASTTTDYGTGGDENAGKNEDLGHKAKDYEGKNSGDQSQENPTSHSSHDTLGTPICKLNKIPDCIDYEYPDINGDSHHTVLQHSESGGRDVWDTDHVRLPCSPENLYPVEQNSGAGKGIKKRWDVIIEKLNSSIDSSKKLEEVILSYNSRYSSRWNFTLLHDYFSRNSQLEEQFFQDVLPKMAKLALEMPKLFNKPIPLLKKWKDQKVTFTQCQTACLLANAFFCTFPRRNSQKKQSEYTDFPDINFHRLFAFDYRRYDAKLEKIKCIIHYFTRVTEKMPDGNITFHRQVVHSNDFPRWDKSHIALRDLHVSVSGIIESEGTGMLQVDFANKLVGGGVFGAGCVQEEIRFIICPELIVSRLITEVLGDNECLIITGCEQYSNYAGYADSFRFMSDHRDQTPQDPWKRKCTQVVAIDALHFRDGRQQFSKSNVIRELNKAYCGFYDRGRSSANLHAVATGNWGCGAFGGDHRLKALIQMMAASAAKRDVVYFTFKDRELAEDIYNVYLLIQEKHLTVADLYKLISEYHKRDNPWFFTQRRLNIFEYIHEKHNVPYMPSGSEYSNTGAVTEADIGIDAASTISPTKYDNVDDSNSKGSMSALEEASDNNDGGNSKRNVIETNHDADRNEPMDCSDNDNKTNTEGNTEDNK